MGNAKINSSVKIFLILIALMSVSFGIQEVSDSHFTIISDQYSYDCLENCNVYYNVTNNELFSQVVKSSFQFQNEGVKSAQFYIKKIIQAFSYNNLITSETIESCPSKWVEVESGGILYYCSENNDYEVCDSLSPNEKDCNVESINIDPIYVPTNRYVPINDFCQEEQTTYGNDQEITCASNEELICHKPDRQTKCVNENSFEAHLNHGDYLGPCTDSSAINACGEDGLQYAPGETKQFKLQSNIYVDSKIKFNISADGMVTTVLDPFFNSSWLQYNNYTINTTANVTDFQVNITVDTAALIAAGKMNSDCSDSRWTFFNSTSNDFEEIPMYLSNLTGESVGCNETDTVFWSTVPNITTDNDTILGHFYGNPTATSVSDGRKVFIIFDDFFGSSINTTQWTEAGNSGVLTVANSLASSSISGSSGGGNGLFRKLTAATTAFECTYCQIESRFTETGATGSEKMYRHAGFTDNITLRHNATDNRITWGFYGQTADTTNLINREGGGAESQNISTEEPGGFNIWRLQWNSSLTRGFLNGVLNRTNDDNIPDIALKPHFILEMDTLGVPPVFSGSIDVDWIRTRAQLSTMDEVIVTENGEVLNRFLTNLSISTDINNVNEEGTFFANFSFAGNSSPVTLNPSMNISLLDGATILVNNATMNFNVVTGLYEYDFISAIPRVITFNVFAGTTDSLAEEQNASDSVTVVQQSGGGGGGGGSGKTIDINLAFGTDLLEEYNLKMFPGSTERIPFEIISNEPGTIPLSFTSTSNRVTLEGQDFNVDPGETVNYNIKVIAPTQVGNESYILTIQTQARTWKIIKINVEVSEEFDETLLFLGFTSEQVQNFFSGSIAGIPNSLLIGLGLILPPFTRRTRSQAGTIAILAGVAVLIVFLPNIISTLGLEGVSLPGVNL